MWLIASRSGLSFAGRQLGARERAALLQVRKQRPRQSLTCASQGSRCDQDGGLIAGDELSGEAAVDVAEEPSESESLWARCGSAVRGRQGPYLCSRYEAMLELLRTEPEAAAVLGFIRANAQVSELTRRASPHPAQMTDLSSDGSMSSRDQRSLLLTLYRSLVLCDSGSVASHVFAVIRSAALSCKHLSQPADCWRTSCGELWMRRTNGDGLSPQSPRRNRWFPSCRW